jgi:hypothetical protein
VVQIPVLTSAFLLQKLVRPSPVERFAHRDHPRERDAPDNLYVIAHEPKIGCTYAADLGFSAKYVNR